jgi:hypothetical protein
MKVLVIEGMGNFPCIKNQLVLPFLAKHPGAFEPIFAAWNTVPKTKVHGAISHSLGGHAGLVYAEEHSPEWLITLDARWMDNLSWLDVGFPWRKPFTAPKGVLTHNFIHTPNVFFPGYKVTGAVENTSVFCTHMNIPSHPAVAKCLEKLVGV